MPYTIELQPAEELIMSAGFRASAKALPFHFAVSNHSLFLPRTKLFAVNDPTYFEKVPLSQVTSVSRIRLRPYFWCALAALMILAGTITTILMVEPLLKGEGGQVSGYPPAIVVVGLVIPFAVKRRFGIEVRMTNGTFVWKPPIVLDRASKDAIRNLQDQIVSACAKVGIHTDDAAAKLSLNPS